MIPPVALRAFPPEGGPRQWPGQARSTAFSHGLLRGHLAGLLCSPSRNPSHVWANAVELSGGVATLMPVTTES